MGGARGFQKNVFQSSTFQTKSSASVNLNSHLATAGFGGIQIIHGMGSQVVIIIQKVPQGGAIYHKRRVQGLRQDEFNKIQVLETVTAESEIPIDVLIPSFKEYEYKAKLIEQILKWADNKCQIKVSIIRKIGANKATITEHYIDWNSKKVIITSRLANFISKAVQIYEQRDDKKSNTDTKVISVEDLIDDVEKADIINIIKELEDLEE